MKPQLLLYFFLLFLAAHAPAQSPSYIRASALYGIQTPVYFSDRYGENRIHSRPVPNWHFDMSYYFPMKKNQGEIMLGYGETQFCFTMDFSDSTKVDFQGTYIEEGNNHRIGNFDTPYMHASFFYHWPTWRNKLRVSKWDYKSGVGLRFRLQHYAQGGAWKIDSLGNVEVNYMRLKTEYRAVVPVIYFGISRDFSIKYWVSFKAGIEACAALYSNNIGTYVMLPGSTHESGGKFHLNGGYVGFRLAIGAPLQRKKDQQSTDDQIQFMNDHPMRLLLWSGAWSAGFGAYCTLPARKTSDDSLGISFDPAPSFTFNVQRRMKLSKRFALTPGLELSFQSMIYSVVNDTNDLPSLTSGDLLLNGMMIGKRRALSPTVNFETVLIGKKWFRLVGSCGITLRLYGNKSYTSYNRFDTLYYHGFSITQGIRKKNPLILNAGIHGEWPGRIGNLQVGIVMEYSPADFVDGKYSWWLGTTAERSGTFTMSGTMIGVRVGYLFQVHPKYEMIDK